MSEDLERDYRKTREKKMKKRMVFGLMIVAILFLMEPAACSINQTDAEQIALKYKDANESLKVYGPYTYMDHPYNYIEFKTGDIKTGIIIIDGMSGKLVKDLNITEKIAYTHCALNGTECVPIEETAKYASELRQISKEMKDRNAEINKLLQQGSADLNSTEKKQLNDRSQALTKSDMSLTNIANDFEQLVIIRRDMLSGNKSYENAEKIMKTVSEMNKNINEFILSTKELDPAIVEDLNKNEGIAQLERYSEELKKFEEGVEKNVSWDVVSTESRKRSIPGFRLWFTVCSVLIVGVFIKRRE